MSDSHLSLNMLVLAPVMLLCLLLIPHSVRRRGLINTISFIIAGLLFFWLREVWAQSEKMYHFQVGSIKVFNVGLMGIVGWFFTSYIALSVVEDFLRKYLPKHENGVFITAALTFVVTLAIANVVETAGQNMGWWVADAEGMRAFPSVFHGAHWFAPAWSATVNFFLLSHLLACAFFKRASGMLLGERVLSQVACNIAILVVFVLVFMFLLGSLSTFFLPFITLILAFIPYSSRLKYC